jgi:hypothetical protein
MKHLFVAASLVIPFGLAAEENPISMKPPTIEQLRSIKDIADNEILPNYISAAIDASDGEFYDQKVKHAVQNQLSERAAHWYFVTSFLGLWGNGGMQAVLLSDPDEIDHKQWVLKKTVEAFQAFGCKETATFIEDLIPKSAKWSKAIGELNRREDGGEDIPEEAFDKVWSEVDAFDDPFDEVFQGATDVYETMTKDVKQHPEKYLRSRKK